MTEQLRRGWLLRGALAITTVTLVVLTTAACGGGAGQSGSSSDTLKVGAVFPLTGPAAANGDWAKLGTEIAVQEINAGGGIDGRKVEVVYADDELQPTKAVTEMNRVINQGKVDIVLGPLTSDTTIATLPIIRASKKPAIMGAGSEKVTPANGPYSFSWTPNATTQAGRMIDAAVADGAKSIAILSDSGTQGKTAAAAMKAAITQRGLNLAGAQEMTITDTDVTPQLLSLKGTNPDHLLLFPVSAVDTGRVLQQIKQLNWNIHITGSYGSTFAAQVEKIAGKDAYANMNAVTFGSFAGCSAASVPKQTVDFVKKVRAFSTERAADAAFDSVAQTYDAMYLMKAAIEATKSTDGSTVAAWLETHGTSLPKDLPYVSQTFGMTKSTHFLVGSDSLAVVNPGTQVSDSVFKRVDCS
jgi:branched-chain amino acid transport system substrate-binding protein